MKIGYSFLIFLMLSVLVVSCKKDVEFYSEPYQDAKESLGVIFDRTVAPSPKNGKPGDEITFKIRGLQDYKNEVIFKVNGEESEIKSISDDEVKIKVPPFASSGVTSITIGDIVIFGPTFEVDGIIKIDPTWAATIGSNGAIINDFVTSDDKIIYVGSFTNYENKGLVRPINRLVRTYRNGMHDVSWRIGTGANGTINKIIEIQDRYFIAGSFSGFDQRTDNISNITSLYKHGAIDTMGVHPFRRYDQLDTIKFYPRFNGGFNSSVSNIYEDDDKIIAAGNFRYYVSRQYDKPNFMETQDTVILDSIEIRQLARLNLDGSLDKTFRFQNDKPFSGGNGNIKTLRHESGDLKGKILVYGEFTKFDEKNMGYITRLNADGTVDDTFNIGGEGADHYINNVTYNELTKKYALTGSFRTFNGVSSTKMVLLNEDGTVDESFKPRSFESDMPSFIKQLDDGLFVVSGGFRQYDKVSRQRFMILNPDGSLHPDLNTTGQFNGYLNKVVETESEDGKRALLLLGSFTKFDNKDVSNIVRIVIE